MILGSRAWLYGRAPPRLGRGRRLRELTNLSNSPADDEDPARSPDGERVAFSSNRAGNREIYVVGRDGRELRRLTHNRTQEGWPAWSPDGRRLLVRRSQNDVESLLVVDARLAAAECLPVSGLPTISTQTWRGDWTPNGRTVVTDIGARITLIDVASGKRRTAPLYATDAKVSPDGSRVLVDTYRSVESPCDICPPVEEAGLLLLDVKTGKSSGLKGLPRSAIDASWSPDGRRLALVLITGETSAERGLFVARANGARLRQLVPRRRAPRPSQ